MLMKSFKKEHSLTSARSLSSFQQNIVSKERGTNNHQIKNNQDIHSQLFIILFSSYLWPEIIKKMPLDSSASAAAAAAATAFASASAFFILN